MPPKRKAIGKKPPKRKSGGLDIGELVREEIRLALQEPRRPCNSGPSSVTSTAAAQRLDPQRQYRTTDTQSPVRLHGRSPARWQKQGGQLHGLQRPQSRSHNTFFPPACITRQLMLASVAPNTRTAYQAALTKFTSSAYFLHISSRILRIFHFIYHYS